MDPENKPQDVPPVVPPVVPPADPPAVPPTLPVVDPTKAELEAANAELTRLRKEKEDRETADLSEKDREKKRADDAEARASANEERLRRVAIIQAVRDAAPGLKVELDVEAVRDLYAAGHFKNVKLDEKTGEPIGIPDMVKGLVTAKPYIVKRATVQAPDINADKKGDEKPGEMTADRQAALKKRFRLK